MNRVTPVRKWTIPIRMLALAVLAAMASGCAPGMEPTPTPTAAFASEEEAFAAAEEVYRAYTDALNAQRAGDESADPLEFLIGSARDSELDAYNSIRKRGLTLEGDSAIYGFHGASAMIGEPVATLRTTVCIDISETRVFDENRNDVTPADRETRFALDVTFTGTSRRLLISDSQSAQQDTEC